MFTDQSEGPSIGDEACTMKWISIRDSVANEGRPEEEIKQLEYNYQDDKEETNEEQSGEVQALKKTDRMTGEEDHGTEDNRKDQDDVFCSEDDMRDSGETEDEGKESESMEDQPDAPGEKEKNMKVYEVIQTQDLSLEGLVILEKKTVGGQEHTKDEGKQKKTKSQEEKEAKKTRSQVERSPLKADTRETRGKRRKQN